MVFSSKKSELLTLTRSIGTDLDLLRNAVLDVFEKLGSKLASMDDRMESLEKKMDDIGDKDELRNRRCCCSNCVIS